jgi:hypothetical protein
VGVEIRGDDRAGSHLRRLRVVGTPLDSRRYAEEIPDFARQSAFFSAKVTDLVALERMKDKLREAMSLPPDKAFASRAAFVADMRLASGAAEGDTDSLRDIDSGRRLGLIYDMQTTSAFERAKAEAESLDPALLDAWPAQELVRARRSAHQRDWRARWTAAGGRFVGGRMIALKHDPVWSRISRFGEPWPPFDYGSGMDTRDISRREAIALRLIDEKWRFPRDQKPWASHLHKAHASAKSLSPEALHTLKTLFPQSISVKGGQTIVFDPLRAHNEETNGHFNHE